MLRGLFSWVQDMLGVKARHNEHHDPNRVIKMCTHARCEALMEPHAVVVEYSVCYKHRKKHLDMKAALGRPNTMSADDIRRVLMAGCGWCDGVATTLDRLDSSDPLYATDRIFGACFDHNVFRGCMPFDDSMHRFSDFDPNSSRTKAIFEPLGQKFKDELDRFVEEGRREERTVCRIPNCGGELDNHLRSIHSQICWDHRFEQWWATKIGMGREVDLDFDEYKRLLTQPCMYCGGLANTIDRVDSSVDIYSVLFGCSACLYCNVRKSTLPLKLFLQRCRYLSFETVGKHLGVLREDFCDLIREELAHRDSQDAVAATMEDPWRCGDCQLVFATSEEAVEHNKEHFYRFVCELCPFPVSFNRSAYLDYHNNSVHADQKPFSCPFEECDYTSADEGNLFVHICVHLNHRPNICDWPLCTYRTITPTRLRDHHNRHTREELHPCPVENCTYVTPDKGNLKYHVFTHSAEKLFPCEYCDGMFKRPASRDVHQRDACLENPANKEKKEAHGAKKAAYNVKAIHVCPEEGCEVRCKKHSKLLVHVEEVHRKSHRETCGCGKTYSNKRCLVRHQKKCRKKVKSEEC